MFFLAQLIGSINIIYSYTLALSYSIGIYYVGLELVTVYNLCKIFVYFKIRFPISKNRSVGGGSTLLSPGCGYL